MEHSYEGKCVNTGSCKQSDCMNQIFFRLDPSNRSALTACVKMYSISKNVLPDSLKASKTFTVQKMFI